MKSWKSKQNFKVLHSVIAADAPKAGAGYSPAATFDCDIEMLCENLGLVVTQGEDDLGPYVESIGRLPDGPIFILTRHLHSPFGHVVLSMMDSISPTNAARSFSSVLLALELRGKTGKPAWVRDDLKQVRFFRMSLMSAARIVELNLRKVSTPKKAAGTSSRSKPFRPSLTNRVIVHRTPPGTKH